MADMQLLGRAILDRLAALEVQQFGSVVGYSDLSSLERAVNARLAALETQKFGIVTVSSDKTSFGREALDRLSVLEGGGGGGSWTPASLPGLAYWYEADAAHSFTDLGVTAVTTDGQLVEQVNDKSGLGHNLTQTNSALRPTWFSNSGKPYWQFTGSSNQELDSASGLTLTDSNGLWWMAVAVSFDNITSSMPAVGIGGTTDIGWIWEATGTARVRSYNSSATGTDDSGSSLTAGTAVVMIGVVSNTSAEIFVDNVSGGSTALTGTRSTNTGIIRLGRGASLGTLLTGKIFAVVGGVGPLSSTDRGNLQTYAAPLHS